MLFPYRFNGAILQGTDELVKLIVKEADIAEFENCQQYKDLAGKGSIAGINNMGILIALFIVVAYFGIWLEKKLEKNKQTKKLFETIRSKLRFLHIQISKKVINVRFLYIPRYLVYIWIFSQ